MIADGKRSCSWPLRIVAATCFGIPAFGPLLLASITRPHEYGRDPVMGGLLIFSAALAGGFFAVRIVALLDSKHLIIRFVSLFAAIFATQALTLGILSFFVSLFTRGDFQFAAFGLFASSALFVIYWGKYFIVSLSISIGLLLMLAKVCRRGWGGRGKGQVFGLSK